jgi:hypothetical protein
VKIKLSEGLSIPFVQEVVASTLAVRRLIFEPVDVVLEIGGEDGLFLIVFSLKYSFLLFSKGKLCFFQEFGGKHSVTSVSLSSLAQKENGKKKVDIEDSVFGSGDSKGGCGCGDGCSSSSSDLYSPLRRNITIDAKV